MQKCMTPIQLTRPDGYKQLVPCGHCVDCGIKRQQGWVIRILLENSQHAFSSFLTLTYDETTRPGTLVYRDVALFLKRWRKSIGRIRYFCCGEYGTRTHREHWHIILFGVQPPTLGATAIEQWPHGGVHFGEVNPASAAYIARYSLKTGGKHDSYYRCGRMMTSSRKPGIGLAKAEQIGFDLVRQKPTLDRMPSFWRVGKSFLPLDRSTYDRVCKGYAAGGGILGETERSPLGYDLDARLFAFVGDMVRSTSIARIERKELERGTF